MTFSVLAHRVCVCRGACLSRRYYPRLTAELVRRGWTKPELRGLFGQNVLRALRANEERAAQLASESAPASTASIARLDDPPAAPPPADGSSL